MKDKLYRLKFNICEKLGRYEVVSGDIEIEDEDDEFHDLFYVFNEYWTHREYYEYVEIYYHVIAVRRGWTNWHCVDDSIDCGP